MHSTLTILKDRALKYNGVSIIEADKIIEYLLKRIPLSQIEVFNQNDDVKNFNNNSIEQIKIFNETEEVKLNYDWIIPDEYKSLDLDNYFSLKIESINKDREVVENRVMNELNEVRRMDFEMGIKTIIYVIDRFRKEGIVWGVGRGSSCASYLLYLIGVHCVNPLKYNIPYTEFFHE